MMKREMHDDYSHARRVLRAVFRGKSLLSSNTDINVCERHACAHFMRMAQSRPNRGPIEAQYCARTGPIDKTQQIMNTLQNQIVDTKSLDILLSDIAIHSCFPIGPRPGTVMYLDCATIGPRLGHAGSPRHAVRLCSVRNHSYVCCHLFVRAKHAHATCMRRCNEEEQASS